MLTLTNDRQTYSVYSGWRFRTKVLERQKQRESYQLELPPSLATWGQRKQAISSPYKVELVNKLANESRVLIPCGFVTMSDSFHITHNYVISC